MRTVSNISASEVTRKPEMTRTHSIGFEEELLTGPIGSVDPEANKSS